jgi:hypothetical protein
MFETGMSQHRRNCEVVYASEIHVEHTRTFCHEAANGFEGVFEALTNQATSFASGI